MEEGADFELVKKRNIIRPLSEAETTEFLNHYRELALNSIRERSKDAENDELYKKISQISYTHNTIDPERIIRIKNRLVRIEYPGEVKNVDKAIETLGGMENIEASVAEHKQKLALRFHPKNRYSKPCMGDKDFKPGILIRVRKDSLQPQPGCSKDEPQVEYDYEVVGVSVMNFTFNRLCDFQYLPLVAEQPETKQSKTEFIYDKIMPNEIPDTQWLTKDESKNMHPFLLPVRFSRYDSSQAKLNTDSNDKSEPGLKAKAEPSTSTKVSLKRQKKISRIFGKSRQQISIFVGFKTKEVPTKPLDATLRLLSNRSLDEQIARVKQLFEERPIWTKAAVRYNTGLTIDHSKIVLPMVAYYVVNGPWRISWVKYGYDPRLDPQARIYQTLDYRIRTGESTKLKVNAKRSYTSKTSFSLGPGHVKKVSLKDNISVKPRSELDERCYVLRPQTIPPARQMFYQFCDLLLPEVQDMISRLPKTGDKPCDPKNGWLPKKFIENCREIVNDYVLQAVRKELLEDNKVFQERVSNQEAQKSREKSASLDYCNQMLDKVKKGIYKNIHFKVQRSVNLDSLGDDVEAISLSDDEGEITVGDIIQSSIPEKMDEEEDDDDDCTSQSSEEAEIDMEAVEEINQMISQANSAGNT